MVEFNDFTVCVIIAVIDICLVIAGILVGLIIKHPSNNFTYNNKKHTDTTIIDVEEVKGVVDNIEYTTTTIKTKRELEKQENEDELE